MDAQARQEQLGLVVDRQIALTRELLELLQSEKAALLGTDPEALQSLAVTKEMRLREIASLEQERQSLLGRGGPATGARAALERSLNNHGMGGALQQRWQQLCEMLALCRDANATNGAIIHLRQRHVRQALNVIRGGRADELTYGPAGSPVGLPPSRGLARV